AGDPHQGLEKGHLRFTLSGDKLHGGWSLVRIKPRGQEKRTSWLLIKAKDDEARDAREAEITEQDPTSVLTGRTVEETGGGPPPPRSRRRMKQPPGKRAAKDHARAGTTKKRAAKDIVHERAKPVRAAAAAAPASAAGEPLILRGVTITHEDRVLDAASGVTKG